jgi:outer membrane protein assembly factor BamD
MCLDVLSWLMLNMMRIIIAVSISALVLYGCNKKKEIRVESEEVLYERAHRSIDSEKYDKAIKDLEELELQYPASDSLSDTMIYKAVAQYKVGEYDNAVASIDGFVKQFPSDHRVAYALYLRGMCHYDQMMDTGRDQTVSRKAFEDFAQLISMFPESKYAVKARFKMDYIDALVAGQDMDIGYFYYNHRRYVAAFGRFKNVVNQHPTTLFAPEALYRLVELSLILNLPSSAKAYAAILGENFADTLWYSKAYELLHKRK